MTKEQMIQIAANNLKKAERALSNNYDRKGITETERQNLLNGVEYAKTVYDLINNIKEV